MRTTPAPRTDFARWLGKNQMDAAPCECVRAVGRGRSPGFTRRKSVAEWFSKGRERERRSGAWGRRACAAMSGASVQCQIGGKYGGDLYAIPCILWRRATATHSLALFAPERVKANYQ